MRVCACVWRAWACAGVCARVSESVVMNIPTVRMTLHGGGVALGLGYVRECEGLRLVCGVRVCEK